jgi:hypothetical protein
MNNQADTSPPEYRHDFCMFCGKLIGHAPGDLPICYDCEKRRPGAEPMGAKDWAVVIWLVIFLGGLGDLVFRDPLIGIPTVIVGAVAGLGWWQDHKRTCHRGSPYAPIDCMRCYERVLRRHNAIDRTQEEAVRYPDNPEVHHDLGKLYEDEGDLENALREYHLADELANEHEPEPDIREFRADCDRVTQLLASRRPAPAK